MNWFADVMTAYGERLNRREAALKAKPPTLLELTPEQLLEKVFHQTRVRINGELVELTFEFGEQTAVDLVTGTITYAGPRDAASQATIVATCLKTLTMSQGLENVYTPATDTLTVEKVASPTVASQFDMARTLVHARRHVECPKLFEKAFWGKDPTEWSAGDAWQHLWETVLVNRKARRVLGPSATVRQRFTLWWITRKLNGQAFLQLLASLNPWRKPAGEPVKGSFWSRCLGRAGMVVAGIAGLGGAWWLFSGAVALFTSSHQLTVLLILVAALLGAVGIGAVVTGIQQSKAMTAAATVPPAPAPAAA